MNIVNPRFKVKEHNIFEIRSKEYSQITDTVREMLRPAEEAGFEITDFGFKSSFSLDVERTLKEVLVIKLRKGTQDIDLSMHIPKLSGGNYIVIGGKRKIPIFQLFDLPVVTRGESIKIRSNVSSMMVVEKDYVFYYMLSFMGLKLPLALVFFYLYPAEQLKEMFDLDNYELSDNDEITPSKRDKFLIDMKTAYSKVVGDYDGNLDDLVDLLGSYCVASSDPKKKVTSFLYAISIIPKIDLMTARFFKNGSVMEEIAHVIMNGGDIDDTDFRNKRIRTFVEYNILAKIAKAVYDLCIHSKTTRNFKLNVNSRQILTDCNVSDIVQFDSAINPIEQLTYLTRCSLVGPGGFSRENIPSYLRDITPSMFGRVCPVDTPDRENCGVLQSLLPGVVLDENLVFTEETIKDNPTSIAVSMVPFLEHDDQTRLQMASSQMRQAISLAEFEEPLIRSGCEGLYSDYTYFVKKARKNGEVVHLDHTWLILAYEDGDCDMFDISSKKTYVENIDLVTVYVSIGDKVKKGDIVAESNFCKNGNIVFGKNLLTAFMPYYGKNYEDAVVISDRLVKDNIMTSVHHMNLSFILPADKILLSLDKMIYKPLPCPNPNIEFDEPGKDKEYYMSRKTEQLAAGSPYAIMKSISDNPLDYYSIFEDRNELISKKDILVTDVTIYPNEYNTAINQFKDWVEKKFDAQVSREKYLQDLIHKYLPKSHASVFIRDRGFDKFSQKGKFKIKGDHINGTLISIHGVFTRKLKTGDKIGNRHGNKGVACEVVPHEMMPRLEDGRSVDICINPLSVPSRMNVGQLYELHLGMSVADLKTNLLKKLKDGNSQQDMKQYLLSYIHIIDNSKDKWYIRQAEEILEKQDISESFINKLTIIQMPFESVTYDQLHAACQYTNTKIEYKLTEPVSGYELVNKIAVGYMYFFRMVHIAETKIAARGIGTYTRRTLQPPRGRKTKGGQRVGEMETACFIAHDGLENLAEILTTKSDCIDAKNKWIRETIGSEYIKDTPVEDMVPEGVKLFENYLKTIGIKI
jgi:DNA-directed RNA polymerase beta subunit